MAKLSDDEKRRILAELEKFEQEKKNTPPSQRVPVVRPERFDFPIGLDEEGCKFPVVNEDERED